ncbi:MAG: PHP domain-containing protein, partial [Chloroflexi bacterium]|nr:PHP domain-containing protein [Chloroflexota bacterium]
MPRGRNRCRSGHRSGSSSPRCPIKRYVDLHLHSTWSDGRWSPRRVVEEASSAGLAAISLTDHDVLDGLAEAAAVAAELTIGFLPGVELTADWEGRTVHVLGHGIDPDDPRLRVALDRGRGLMGEHVDRVLAALHDAGEPLVSADLDKYRARYAGGASLVLAMVEWGVLRRARDGAALLRLASQEPRAYTAAEAIDLIHAAGGIASLAHPIKVRPVG